MKDSLAYAYPTLARQLPKMHLADLPTPVESRQLDLSGQRFRITVKRDDLSGKVYGGNKVRKLEYLLHRARQRDAACVATFGTVGSHHALATALYARALGFHCTCFLSNQVKTAGAARALNMHLANDTEIVRYGGDRQSRIATLRKHLHGRRPFLIPPGGSSWRGAIGFVNAGLEFAAQVRAGETSMPDRIYVANGTMATAVGIALGLALAELDCEVQAVQVTEDFVSNPAAMHRLLEKTAALLARFDPAIPGDLALRSRCIFRRGYLGAGYARTNASVETAIGVARDQLGIELEATYTGKAMAALLDDLGRETRHPLFWNTYNSRPLPAGIGRPADGSRLPQEFLRYFD
jgi:D-cysteine desulfhydrase